MKHYVKRLRRLAAGAEPYETCFGICNDLHENCDKTDTDTDVWWNAYSALRPVFGAFGLDDEYPLGTVPRDDSNLWVGREGELRRRLAGAVANYIEHGTIDGVLVVEIREWLNDE